MGGDADLEHLRACCSGALAQCLDSTVSLDQHGECLGCTAVTGSAPDGHGDKDTDPVHGSAAHKGCPRPGGGIGILNDNKPQRPKFLSVVTISFNQKDFLRQTLDSVISQKSDDVEYIVVDPGSSDGSRELLKQYESDIDVLIFEPDEGPADGLNKGFARASGRIGYFLNSDDFLLPGAVERMRNGWEKNADADLLLGGGWMVDQSGVPIRELAAMTVSLQGLLVGATTMVQQGMSFRMSAFRKIGGFNKENRSCWDYELLCAMLHAGSEVRTMASRLGAFRYYANSLSGGRMGDKHHQAYMRELDRIHLLYAGEARRLLPAPILALMKAKQLLHPHVVASEMRNRFLTSRMSKLYDNDVNSDLYPVSPPKGTATE